MKRLLSFAVLLTAFVASAAAQKTVYIPNEWRNPWPSDSLLYKESDPDGRYTWSKTRSVESDNVIIFWDKYYTKNPKELPKSNFYYVDIDDLLQKCEAFYDLEINQLGFVDPVTSNVAKYKVMVLMNHTETWTCYGGGYDFQVPALWLNPSTCKPVGQAVAHEVGHSFHYMCFSEHGGHRDSDTDNTGFHLACGNGQAIWEQTAQWQSLQSYPNLMYDQSIGIFRNSHNYAFSHEWHRYQSYWFHYYLCQYYNDITTVAQVWNTPMTGQSRGRGSDFNEALMKLKNLSVRDLFKLYFDYACRLVTWDLDVCKPYRNNFIGDFNYRCVLTADGQYQVALASCPQGSGFNVIPLEVPAAGTAVTTHLTALHVGDRLADADPGEYLDGDSRFSKASRRTYNAVSRTARGFRMGYVALMQDGSRQYFAEDSVYCQGQQVVTQDYGFTVPEGVSRLWLVVSPALKSYVTHRWDDTLDADDMWPYRFSLEGTDLGSHAIVYASPTLDGREVSNVTLNYDVSFPCTSNGNYSGTNVSISGQAAATLGTALQLQPTDIASLMQSYSASGPSAGRIMFYACKPDGTLAQSKSTANGYGHWFNAAGNVCDWGSGYVYSEFDPSSLTFTVGQYPDKCKNGSKYTIRQALRYRTTEGRYAVATFVFNITTGPAASVMLTGIDYQDPTGIYDVERLTLNVERYYDLQGRRLGQPRHGLNIIGGRKVIIK